MIAVYTVTVEGRAAVALLSELTGLGYDVHTQGDNLVIAGGRSPLDDGQRIRIRTLKPELLTLVRRFEADEPSPDVSVH